MLGAILGNNGALIVDAGNSPAHANALLEGLRQLAEPKYVALTHWHWDHVFGTAAFDVPIVAHEETRRIVEHMAQLDWSDEALDRRVAEGTEIEFCRDMMKTELAERTNLRLKSPDISFDTQIELDLGGVSCQIRHVGGDHSSDSSVVYVRADKVVFLGDCLYEDLHHGPRRYTSEKLFRLIDVLLAYAADYYLFGHELKPMTGQQLVGYAGLLRSISQEVERLGNDRDRIIRSRQHSTGAPLEEEHLQIVDAFLAGLQGR